MMTKNSEKSKIAARISRIAVVAVLVLALLFLLPLTLHSLFGRVDMNMNNNAVERSDYIAESFWLNLGLLVAFVAVALLCWILSQKVPFHILLAAVGTVVAAVGILYLVGAASSPSADSKYVTDAAAQAALGNYFDTVKTDGATRRPIADIYFVQYPFQLGYVFFCEILIRLFQAHSWYVGLLAGVNLICLLGAEAAVADTVRRLFGEQAGRITLLLFLFCLQPICFTTFLYGNIPSFAFAVGGIWLMVLFSQKRRWYFAAGCAFSFALSVCIKFNSIITVVAMAAVCIILALHRRRWSFLLLAAGTVGLSLLCKELCVLQYEWRTGLEFGSGIPLTAWLAMGLQSSAYRGPGQYNGYTVSIFAQNNYDSAATSEVALQEIRNRLAAFSEDPVAARAFFREKFLTQWNETSYQSLWNTEVRGKGWGDLRGLADLLCGEKTVDGKTVYEDGITKRFMDVYTQGVFVFATGGCVHLALRHRDRAEMAIFPLILFGGMLYHLLWEAKSQYALTYLFCLVPLAAVGLCAFLQLAYSLFCKKIGKDPLGLSGETE